MQRGARQGLQVFVCATTTTTRKERLGRPRTGWALILTENLRVPLWGLSKHEGDPLERFFANKFQLDPCASQAWVEQVGSRFQFPAAQRVFTHGNFYTQ